MYIIYLSKITRPDRLRAVIIVIRGENARSTSYNIIIILMGTIVGRSCENKNTTRTTGDRLQSVIPVRSVLSYIIVHDRDGEGYMLVVCAHFTFVQFCIIIIIIKTYRVRATLRNPFRRPTSSFRRV